MNYRNLGLFAILVLLCTCGGLILLRDYVAEPTAAPLPYVDRDDVCSAAEKIAGAEARLAAGEPPAEVITRSSGDVRQVAVVFDGLPERPLASRLLEVLQRHHVPAVFFVEGQNAVHQPETIRLIRAAGQEIGNYTYVGIRGAEKLPTKRLLAELCRTQHCLGIQMQEVPCLFRAPHTVYTDSLLRAVHAAGLTYAVKENVRHTAGTFREERDAAAFAAAVPAGSILAIGLSQPVDVKEASSEEIEERPAVDKKPTIKDPPSAQSAGPPADAADELEWMLTAFEAAGIEVRSIHAFRKIRYVSEPSPVAEAGRGGV